MTTKIKKPTPGEIIKAMTKEVSIVPKAANGDEFLVKDENGVESGPVVQEIIQKLHEYGLDFAENTGSDDTVLEDGSIAEKLGKLFTDINTLETELSKMKDGEGQKGRADKVNAALTEAAQKFMAALTEAGVIGDKAGSAAVGLAQKLEDEKVKIKDTPETPASQDDMPRPEKDSKTQTIQSATGEAAFTASEQLSQRNGNAAISAMSKADFAEVVETVLAKLFNAEMAKPDQTTGDQQSQVPVSEDIKKLQAEMAEVESQIAQERVLIESEALKKQHDSIYEEMNKQLIAQKAELERLRKTRTGSKSLDTTTPAAPDGDSTVSETTRKSMEFAKDFEGSPIGAFGVNFRSKFSQLNN